MTLHAWKLKPLLGSFFLVMIALLAHSPSARAQGSAFDFPSDHAFASRTGAIEGTVYLSRSTQRSTGKKVRTSVAADRHN